MAIDWTKIGVDLSVPEVPAAISDGELTTRWRAVQAAMIERELDALLVVGNESEFSSLRYLSDYWPAFESGAVLFAPEGEPVLLAGPESETHARHRGRVSQVALIESLRESADPSYPEVSLDTYDGVLRNLGVSSPRRIGIAGSFAANMVIIDELQRAFGDVELVRADDVVTSLRAQKSPWEIANLRKAFEISEIALSAILERIRPGMTELQVVGIAQAAMYANGAEYEGMPQYVLSGPNSRPAISRPANRVLESGDVVQLNISARVNGYSSGVGRPLVLGKATTAQRDLIEFCRDAHLATLEWVRPGVEAASIARNYQEFFTARNKSDAFLYGPCTGLGLMETEQPWVESDSKYTIQPGMCFQADTFAQATEFSVRWENGFVVRDEALEMFSGAHMDTYEV
ncbi:Xaa-Pro peptidase family protein [Microbacterium sp. Mu-80]|uniref:Xaa-Pro peptidase family protein n=1 Tax=Microbacterium bandirmense TaxID=3122050 RepID=A0ABU8LGM2_9MICO